MEVNFRNNFLNCSNSGVLFRYIIFMNKLGKIIVVNFVNYIVFEISYLYKKFYFEFLR